MKRNPLPSSALKAGANELPCNVSNIDQAIITSNVHMQEKNKEQVDRSFPQMYFHQHGSEHNEILRPTYWAIQLGSLVKALCRAEQSRAEQSSAPLQQQEGTMEEAPPPETQTGFTS